jgi:hypothetical protein
MNKEITVFKSWDELTPLEQSGECFSDYFKDAHGFRPRHIDTSSWTLEDFDREFAELAVICKANDIQEEIDQKEASLEFEARVQTVINTGAKDRETAIQWIADSEGCNADLEHLCFLNRLPYNYFKKVTA